MNIGKGTVLHKGADINNLSSFRPISILPVLSKGLEKIIHNRLTSIFEKYYNFSPSQFRFLKKISSEIALLTEKEITVNAYERKFYTLEIFIDLTKAFDHFDSCVLFNKQDAVYETIGK